MAEFCKYCFRLFRIVQPLFESNHGFKVFRSDFILLGLIVRNLQKVYVLIYIYLKDFFFEILQFQLKINSMYTN